MCLSVYVSSLGGDRVGCVLWVCFGGPFHGMLLRCVSGYVSGICFAEVEPTITDPYWLWHRITVRSTSNEEDIYSLRSHFFGESQRRKSFHLRFFGKSTNEVLREGLWKSWEFKNPTISRKVLWTQIVDEMVRVI